MMRYVAFLRGINLGNRRLPMSRLKALFEGLGFEDVQTFIASGNVLFSTAVAETGPLELRIAKHLETSLSYRVDPFVRTLGDVVDLGKMTVFPEQGQEGITVHVGFLQQRLPTDIEARLNRVRTDQDEFRVVGREYYWLCRIRTSESTVWTLPEVKALRLPTSTMRNMSSIRKLIAKHMGCLL